ncbi:unnamed protein product [Pedinophyceae sp. YPF-701]|nr:unnamed protein product [Pedinophyceae sp. YPF-701]
MLKSTLVLLIVILSIAGRVWADAGDASRQRQAQTTPSVRSGFSRLRTYVDVDALKGDPKTCYATSDVVRMGDPDACGYGCQFASTIIGSSSASAFGTAPLLGAPDKWPLPNEDKLGRIWMPSTQNAGTEFIEFSVNAPVYVTGFWVYEACAAGAIVLIEGRGADGVWTRLWNGTASPVPGTVLQGDTWSCVARLFKPDVQPPRQKLLQDFRITLNTAQVTGPNQLDAVQVFGDDSDGRPVDDTSLDTCAAANVGACWLRCTNAVDVAFTARVDAALALLQDVAVFFARALTIANPTAPVKVPRDTDGLVKCGDVDIPAYLADTGLQATSLVVVPTLRPDTQVLRVSACHTDAGTQRPFVLRVNMVPQYVDPYTGTDERLRRLAMDALLHELYRAMGWSSQTLAAVRGTASVTEAATVSFFGQNPTTWNQRYTITTNAQAILGKAREHFGAASLQSVEFENDNAVGFGGTAVTGRMLEHRIFLGELMTTPVWTTSATYASASAGWTFPSARTARPLHRSAISLALFEDLGFYVPDYAAAEPLSWGFQRGETFPTEECFRWVTPNAPSSGASDASAYGVQEMLTCPPTAARTAFDPAGRGDELCSHDRTFKWQCQYADYGTPLLSQYSYFDSAISGGFWQRADFCPLVAPSYAHLPTGAPSGSPNPADTTGRDCTDGAFLPAGSTGEEYGTSSRCFTTVVGTDAAETTYANRCFKTTCIGSALLVKLGASWQRCPDTGGRLFSTGLGVTTFCPPATQLCAGAQAGNPKPDVRVYTDVSLILRPYVRVDVEVTNFAIGEAGRRLRVTLGGVEVGSFAQTITTPVISLFLQDLPEAAAGTTMSFELVDALQLVHATDQRTVRVQHEGLTQFAASTTASSQYTSAADLVTLGVLTGLSCPASGAVGSQAITSYGVDQPVGLVSRAWSPLTGGAGIRATPGVEFLEVTVPVAVIATDVALFEAFSPGTLSRVLAWNATAQSWAVVYRAERFTQRQLRTRNALRAGNTIGAAATNVYRTRPVDVFSDRFRLEFATPSWVHLDAVQITGNSAMLANTPAHVPGPTNTVEVALGSTGAQVVPLTFTKANNATLAWELVVTSGATWLSVPSTSQRGFAVGTAPIEVTVLVNATAAGSAREFLLRGAVTLRNRLVGSAALGVANVNLLRNTLSGFDIHTPPCVHGMVVPSDTADSSGTCRCFPGAYGSTCEFLECPRGCSSNANENRGVCDRYTGKCACQAGFYGVDCSGVSGGCTFSFDGTCGPSFSAGRYVINGEDSQNLNRGDGVLPRSMQCGGGDNFFGCDTLVRMELCCRASTNAVCPFRANSAPCASPSCPFTGAPTAAPATQGSATAAPGSGAATAAPNTTAPAAPTPTVAAGNGSRRFASEEEVAVAAARVSERRAQGNATTAAPGTTTAAPGTTTAAPGTTTAAPGTTAAGAAATQAPPTNAPGTTPPASATRDLTAGIAASSACLTVVNNYCFYQPDDPACHWFRPHNIPSDFPCPAAVIAKFCAMHPFDADCATYVEQKVCRFGASGPCESAACRADLLSSACRAEMRTYCTANPTDRECIVQGLAPRGCLFAAGSAPCVDSDCLTNGWERDVSCNATIATYCATSAGAADPECIVRGYVAAENLVIDSNACPLTTVQRACDEFGAADEFCVLLRMYGVTTRSELAPFDAAPTILARLDGRIAQDSSRLAVTQREVEIGRREFVARHALYSEFFAYADADANGRLALDEVPAVSRFASALRSGSGRGFPAALALLSALTDAEIAAAVAPTTTAGGDGAFVTRSELFTRLEAAYQLKVLP